jgi:hypothetical protein
MRQLSPSKKAVPKERVRLDKEAEVVDHQRVVALIEAVPPIRDHRLAAG